MPSLNPTVASVLRAAFEEGENGKKGEHDTSIEGDALKRSSAEDSPSPPLAQPGRTLATNSLLEAAQKRYLDSIRVRPSDHEGLSDGATKGSSEDGVHKGLSKTEITAGTADALIRVRPSNNEGQLDSEIRGNSQGGVQNGPSKTETTAGKAQIPFGLADLLKTMAPKPQFFPRISRVRPDLENFGHESDFSSANTKITGASQSSGLESNASSTSTKVADVSQSTSSPNSLTQPKDALKVRKRNGMKWRKALHKAVKKAIDAKQVKKPPSEPNGIASINGTDVFAKPRGPFNEATKSKSQEQSNQATGVQTIDSVERPKRAQFIQIVKLEESKKEPDTLQRNKPMFRVRLSHFINYT